MIIEEMILAALSRATATARDPALQRLGLTWIWRMEVLPVL